MKLIDSHCHLDDSRFDAGRVEVLMRARAAGVDRIVVPAVHHDGWQRLAGFAEETPSIFPAYGLHPWFCEMHHERDLALLPAFLGNAVAVGECGLDFGKGRAPESEQLKWFRAQLELAAEHALPVIIHAYKSLDQVLHELRMFPTLKGVIHSFSGSLQQAEQLMAQGFSLGIGGAITWPQAERLRTVVKEMPLEYLLLETDAPDQSGAKHRGERNEPAFLVEIADEIATIRGIETDELAEMCNRNTGELFGI